MIDRLDPLDYYRMYWKRFRLSRRVQQLHWAARGFLRELLEEQFAEGFIPDDIAEIASICRCPLDVMREHWPAIEPFFPVVEEGRRLNSNQEENRTEMDAKRIQQKLAGLRSGEVRAARAKQALNDRSSVAEPEENRRGQKRIETIAPATPAPDQDDTQEGSDPRHVSFRAAIHEHWRETVPNSTRAPWDGSEGKALARLLSANPDLTFATFTACLGHRAQSVVQASDRPRRWLETVTDYLSGPKDEYGKPLQARSRERGTRSRQVASSDETRRMLHREEAERQQARNEALQFYEDCRRTNAAAYKQAPEWVRRQLEVVPHA